MYAYFHCILDACGYIVNGIFSSINSYANFLPRNTFPTQSNNAEKNKDIEIKVSVKRRNEELEEEILDEELLNEVKRAVKRRLK